MSYSLFSSTLYDPLLRSLSWNRDARGKPQTFLLLHYHLQRLADAAEKHKWPEAQAALALEAVISVCENAVKDYTGPASQSFRIRIVLTKAGQLTAAAFPTPSLSRDPTDACFFNPNTDSSFSYQPILSLNLDTEPTESSIFTTTKTTNRAHYDAARTRANVPAYGVPNSGPPTDVLLYNTYNVLTETSIHNVAFFRGGRWMTPPLMTGCLPGVIRRWLLQEGRIIEADPKTLTRDSVKDGDFVLVFNGVQGCKIGRVRISSLEPQASA